MDTHTQDFGTSVSGVMASLGQSASKMLAAAGTMSEAATRTRDHTSSAVEGANASARDLNSVAVAAEQMTASIREISRQVENVTSAVRTAVDLASETDAKVAGLATTADRIGDVVRLISDIAGQTNLLHSNQKNINIHSALAQIISQFTRKIPIDRRRWPETPGNNRGKPRHLRARVEAVIVSFRRREVPPPGPPAPCLPTMGWFGPSAAA